MPLSIHNAFTTEPLNVPVDFTTPGRQYKKQVILASFAIITFISLYFGLAFWFIYKAYFLFSDLFSGGRNGFVSFFVALLSSFMGIFMLKAIFFLNRKNKDESFEITREDEPQLFDFIYKLADQANAPRPHKIFLTNTVNASVFYDISFINLLFRPRKNLEIGLGLVNVFNLGEFKSILAHEFGHFTQKSMLVGRWVYIAHQVVYQIVARRDSFDVFLNKISRIDFRLAWIGWILSSIVWSIRSLVEILFKIVVLTQRALSREMEFHADLVAVSLTGSDAIVHSLYKLHAADESFENAIEFVKNQLQHKKQVANIYALQENLISHLRVVLNNPDYGKSPTQNFGFNKKLLFREQIARPPKMWETHPSNIDREKNAKKVYVVANIDNRPAWILFKDPEKTKEKLTRELFSKVKTETTLLSIEESLKILNNDFQRTYLLPEYRGVYHNRCIFIGCNQVKDIYDNGIEIPNLAEKLSTLYPSDLQEQMQHLRNLEEELFMLVGLNKKALTATEGKIIFRGSEINHNELPGKIQSTKNECEIEKDKLVKHLYTCRIIHNEAAKNIGSEWGQYLASLAGLIHYCEHTQKNIEVQSKFLFDTMASVLSFYRIDSMDISFLCRAANDLHTTLEDFFNNSKSITLNPQLVDRLQGKQFAEFLEPFILQPASTANIRSWVNVVGYWINLASNSLNELRFAALDELLDTESYIKDKTLSGNVSNEKAPDLIEIPGDYSKYDPSIKRKIITQTDFYSKFQNADGLIPSIAKYSVAAIIIFIAIFFASNAGTSNVIIYNGFPTDVIVYVNNKAPISVTKGIAKELIIDIEPEINIRTTTTKGELIETFKQELDKHSKTYIYNIANSALIYTWVVYYNHPKPPKEHGLVTAKRWFEIKADYYFVPPPESVKVYSGEAQKRVVVDELKSSPEQLVNIIDNDEDIEKIIKTHAIWESPSSPNIITWLNYSARINYLKEAIDKRLQLDPFDIPALRYQQDFATGLEKVRVCEELRKLLQKYPKNPNFYYLSCRCIENEAKRDSAFMEGYKKWPYNAWLSNAVGYSYLQKENWKEAASCFVTASEGDQALQPLIVDNLKRINQLLGNKNLIDDKELQSNYLSFVDDVENSTLSDPNNVYYAYKLLEKGEIDDAVNYAQSDTNISGYVLRLAAVSKGASKSVINKAKALSNSSYINRSTIIPAIAFASRNNLPLTDFLDAYRNQFGTLADSVSKFIDLVKRNNINEAEKLTNIGDLRNKGEMSLLGVLLLGNKAPEKWKLYADKLLYICEKPYLGSETKTIMAWEKEFKKKYSY